MLQTIKAQALAHGIPIMEDDTLKYLIALINTHKIQRVLEIGTAIGHSSLTLAYHCPSLYIDTLENDGDRYEIALNNQALMKDKQVTMHLVDARYWTPTDQYDLIIIDGAKGQNNLFFNRYLPYLKIKGIIVVDNMHFHGHVHNIPLGKRKRNLRQLVNKIIDFQRAIRARDDVESERVDVGDGLLKITKKRE